MKPVDVVDVIVKSRKRAKELDKCLYWSPQYLKELKQMRNRKYCPAHKVTFAYRCPSCELKKETEL